MFFLRATLLFGLQAVQAGSFADQISLERWFGSEAATPVALKAAGRLAVVPFFDPATWAGLPAVQPRTAKWLAGVAPWADPASTRELTPPEARKMFVAAASRRASLLDLFTDAGLRGGQAYYIPIEVMAALDAEFELPLLYPVAGKADDGRPFRMTAVVLGRGHADIFYDRDQFEYATSWFPDYHYVAASHIKQAIRGEGSLDVEGVWADAGLFGKVRLLKFVKTGPDAVRIETSLMSKTKPLLPIRKR
jgi:hypothetical protein